MVMVKSNHVESQGCEVLQKPVLNNGITHPSDFSGSEVGEYQAHLGNHHQVIQSEGRYFSLGNFMFSSFTLISKQYGTLYVTEISIVCHRF